MEVTRSAAVTLTVTAFVPVTSVSFPATTTTASGSLASATTLTEVVPSGTFTTAVSRTASPSTAKIARVVSVFAPTCKLIE